MKIVFENNTYIEICKSMVDENKIIITLVAREGDKNIVNSAELTVEQFKILVKDII